MTTWQPVTQGAPTPRPYVPIEPDAALVRWAAHMEAKRAAAQNAKRKP